MLSTNIVELRQYTLHPGQRDVLIALFEREFIESQEELGLSVIGTFHDADNPDRFVWLRGFPDMHSRARSLAAFYGGPVWKAHREAANATMIDSDNVLLLHPAWDGAGFAEGGRRAPQGATALPGGMVVASIYYYGLPVSIARAVRDGVVGACEASGGQFLAAFVTEESVNTFPALPVREGEHVFVAFALFPDFASVRPIVLPDGLRKALVRPVETLRLIPTARSRLHAPMLPR